MDMNDQPYWSRRSPVMAKNGVVATTQPVAAGAGVAILRAGGNAVDAAIATAAMMTVVEPTSNGLGSDAFALIWDGSRLHGYNGSGRAPAGLTADRIRAAGHTTMPQNGWFTVTVPGAPRTWADLNKRFGRLPLQQVLQPAIDTALDGYAVTPVIAGLWAGGANTMRTRKGPEFEPWWETFAPGGTPPEAGTIWGSEDHARSLQRIAETGADAFYEGELAIRIADFARRTGGVITEDDLAAHSGTWVDPISTCYSGHDVWEIPPSGQGLAALLALSILEGMPLGERDTPEAHHLQIEAMRLAFEEADQYIGDPDYVQVPVEQLLSREHAAARRALIGDRAEVRYTGDPKPGGTIYLCAADRDGMMVSYIQSNYGGFGSGVVVPGTGIALHNRGFGFTLDESHPNGVRPGHRPYHSIIPGFLTKDGRAIGPFGVMGGHMQPQGHMQVVLNTVTWGMNPQAALDAPRWMTGAGVNVMIESEAGSLVIDGLRARGHHVEVQDLFKGPKHVTRRWAFPSGRGISEGRPYGNGQIIWRLPSGALIAGSEPRADGCAAAY